MNGLPEGWQAKPLKDVLQKTGSIDPRKNPDDGFEYIDVSSISRKTFSIEKTSSLKGKEAPSRARRQVRTGDVLFATIRPTLQRIAIVPEVLNGEVCSTGYFICRPKEKLIENRFLYHYLFTENFMSAMESRQKGASYPAVNNRDVQEQFISFPSLSEQKRIVAILDEAFAGIDQAIANTEKNLTHAREVFESYLNGVFTRKDAGWEEKTLGQVYDVRDGTHDSPKYQEKGYPLITSKNLKREGLNYNKVRYISKKDYLKINERSAVHKGDILFAMIGTIGNPIVVDIEPDFAIKNVALLKLTDGQNSKFLKYYLQSKPAMSKMIREAKGTTQKFVGLGYLRKFPISIPEVSIQIELVQQLDAVLLHTQHLESIYQKKLNALAELKQSILQKAFTGELTQAPEQELAEVC